ncbi:hypothetical protein CYL21_4663 [Plasmodium falciparum NF54]|uniref:Uncharacterized protein n=2 Tax=Plasmodium falciparum TaxID=5833 RepID=Q8I4R8_PLAF7|nr:conserved Plasmodium protein, unknown function [Plasmodium falciparum 3D7]KAF4327182.1 hypothetical protein CYL21_4663 [Plasmodium falciparum NF54]PKC48348.1 hypothetical protein CK202_1761 [Plasmodium falciparum NF54]CZT99671.1 conserved Plasmodium protein, unknown function [Plasmodium falciparum 3D7]|eukprot:XP_001350900.1 conserved Plasmodium protein, unknown function [Plasmodium falciparum 3D7]
MKKGEKKKKKTSNKGKEKEQDKKVIGKNNKGKDKEKYKNKDREKYKNKEEKNQDKVRSNDNRTSHNNNNEIFNPQLSARELKKIQYYENMFKRMEQQVEENNMDSHVNNNNNNNNNNNEKKKKINQLKKSNKKEQEDYEEKKNDENEYNKKGMQRNEDSHTNDVHMNDVHMNDVHMNDSHINNSNYKYIKNDESLCNKSSSSIQNVEGTKKRETNIKSKKLNVVKSVDETHEDIYNVVNNNKRNEEIYIEKNIMCSDKNINEKINEEDNKNDNEEEKNDHRLSDLGNVDKKDELLLEDNKDILIKNIIYDKGNILKEQNDMMKKEICYDDFNRNIFHSNDIEHINKIKEEEFTNKNIYKRLYYDNRIKDTCKYEYNIYNNKYIELKKSHKKYGLTNQRLIINYERGYCSDNVINYNNINKVIYKIYNNKKKNIYIHNNNNSNKYNKYNKKTLNFKRSFSISSNIGDYFYDISMVHLKNNCESSPSSSSSSMHDITYHKNLFEDDKISIVKYFMNYSDDDNKNTYQDYLVQENNINNNVHNNGVVRDISEIGNDKNKKNENTYMNELNNLKYIKNDIYSTKNYINKTNQLLKLYSNDKLNVLQYYDEKFKERKNNENDGSEYAQKSSIDEVHNIHYESKMYNVNFCIKKYLRNMKYVNLKRLKTINEKNCKLYVKGCTHFLNLNKFNDALSCLSKLQNLKGKKKKKKEKQKKT